MTDLDTLTSLRERVIAAEGPDREIDAAIWLATTPGATRSERHVSSSKGLWPDYTIDETRDATRRLITVPPVTASIDAALGLVERVLPGVRVFPDIRPSEKEFCCGIGEARGRLSVHEWAASPALAILAALLSALIANAKGET